MLVPTIEDLNIVALLEDVLEAGPTRGETGTVVHDFGVGAYLVEFSDLDGQNYALSTLRAEQLLLLHSVAHAEIED